MALGDRIKTLRRESGLTQEEFGKIYEITKTTVSGYETGVRNPDLAFLISMSNDYHVSLDWLLGRSNTRKFTESEPDVLTGLNNKEKEEVQDFANYLRMKKAIHPTKQEHSSTCDDTNGGRKIG